MADVKIVPDTGDTISFGTAAKPAQEVVITGSILNASSVGATPAAIAGAVTHAGTTGNPHNTTAANVGAEPALGNPDVTGKVLSSTTGGVRSWVAQAGGMTWTVITTGTTTATAGNGYLMNGSGGNVTLNLPAGTAGNLVGFADVYGKATTNTLTIAPNGAEKIHGSATGLVIDINYASGTLAYVDATRGWELVDAS